MGNHQSNAYNKLLSNYREKKDAEFTKHLVRYTKRYSNFDVANHIVENGKTLLEIACAEGREDIVTAILRVCKSNGNGACLHSAIENGNLRVVKLLLENSDINPNAQMNQKTPLHAAINKGSYSSCLLLLKHGADPNIQNGRGQTALHTAANIERKDLAELVLKHSNMSLDIDNLKDHRNQSAREILLDRFPDLDLILGRVIVDFNVLQECLENRQEMKFCDLLEKEEKIVSEELKKLIEMAAKNSLSVALIRLMRIEGALYIDLTEVVDDALHRADYRILQILLDAKVLLRNDYDLLLRASRLLGITCEAEKSSPGSRLECFKLVLHHKNVPIRYEVYKTAKKEDTPMHWVTVWACMDAADMLAQIGKLNWHATALAVNAINTANHDGGGNCDCGDCDCGDFGDCDCGDCGDCGCGDCGDCSIS